MAGRLSKAILVALSTAATLLALEVAIRAGDLARGRSMDARTSWYWLYRQDPCLGHRGRAHARARMPQDLIAHNAEGFRDDRELAAIPRDRSVRLVVCVGESSTYGLSAGANAATYPAALERRLRALSGDQGWTVFNAGMPGYTSRESRELLQIRLLRAKPDIVVSMNLRNDLEFAVRYLDATVAYDDLPLRVAQLSATWPNEILMRSSLYGMLATRLRSWYGDDLGGRAPPAPHDRPTPEGLEFYRSNLEQMALVCSRAGARLMCVDQPVDERFATYDAARKASLADLRSVLATFCRERGVPLLAANSRIAWDRLEPSDDVHLGPRGYEELADILALQILEADRDRVLFP